MTDPFRGGGGNWNHDKHWKKLREKHRNAERLGKRHSMPEVYDGPDDYQAREIEIDKAIYDLRYDLAFGKITEEEFEIKMKELNG